MARLVNTLLSEESLFKKFLVFCTTVMFLSRSFSTDPTTRDSELLCGNSPLTPQLVILHCCVVTLH